jgi:hypothetical protein
MGSGVLAPRCRWSWYLYHWSVFCDWWFSLKHHWSVFCDWWFSLKWVGYRLHTDSVLIALMRRGGKEPGWETEIWRGTPVPAEHDNVRYLERGSRRVGFGSSSSSKGVSGETHPMFGGQLLVAEGARFRANRAARDHASGDYIRYSCVGFERTRRHKWPQAIRWSSRWI